MYYQKLLDNQLNLPHETKQTVVKKTKLERHLLEHVPTICASLQ